MNIFPEGLQPGSDFPHCDTSCLRAAEAECGNGCKGTRPFPFSLSPKAVTFRKTPVNWCPATKYIVSSLSFVKIIWSFGEKKKKTTAKPNYLHYKPIMFLHSAITFAGSI